MSNHQSKRIYLGNLPMSHDIRSLSSRLLHHVATETGVTVSTGHLKVQKGHAFLTLEKDHDSIRTKLDGSIFEGRKLVAQNERGSSGYSYKQGGRGFGGSWARPSSRKTSRKPEIPQSVKKWDTNQNMSSYNEKETPGATQEVDFSQRQQGPLSELMAEYGDFDPNWKKVEPSNDSISGSGIASGGKSQLASHGTAPIHILYSSFGYVHGAPSHGRRAMDHSSPLAPLDCRHLTQVDPSQVILNGLSGGVKRFLMSSESPNVSDLSRQLAKQTLEAILDAIEEGHGYANNLCIKIFVGSELGRHRSVVLVELAAIQLRNHLRENAADLITQPCSVGTFHRDIGRLGPKSIVATYNSVDTDNE